MNHLLASGTHKGKHNHVYYLTLNVTNTAGLVHIKRLTILVDASPPETGVVLDGLEHGPDIDYQSTRNGKAHWKGFYDHESGIHHFKYAIADRCLTREEIFNETIMRDIQHATTNAEAVDFQVEVLKKYCVTVVAINNAGEPSGVGCSDGVTIDTTPPVVDSVAIAGARVKPGIGCLNGSVWYVSENRTRIQLQDTEACLKLCTNSSHTASYFNNFPINPNWNRTNQEEFSTVLCSANQPHQSDQIFIARDSINIKWHGRDDESEMHHFEIGFSTNGQTADLIGFETTNQRQYYHKVYLGFGHGSSFFIIMKATNKAFLTTTTVIGPVEIDQTAPSLTGNLDLTQSMNTFSISWTRDGLQDVETGVLTVEYSAGTDKMTIIIIIMLFSSFTRIRKTG